MKKSYKLKCYANKSKTKELNVLLAFWQDQVNHKIRIFWGLNRLNGSYPAAKHRIGGRLKSDTSLKAWQIVKGARKTKQKSRPHFTGNEIDLNQASAYIIPNFQTKEFDIWFNVINLDKNKRLKLPCKKTKIFNEALMRGELRKSFKLLKINGDYYIEVFIEFPEKKKDNKKLIGIDVGLNNAIATSDGKIMGQEIKALRIRTKHRTYKKKISPTKQKLNYYAKKLVIAYPNTDFAVEELSFKGKRKGTRKFRRRNNNWAYNHLANKLIELGHLEGFQVIKVDPAYSSQTCPMCEFTNKANRRGLLFLCNQCGYKGNADIIGAINLTRRVAQEHSVSVRCTSS